MRIVCQELKSFTVKLEKMSSEADRLRADEEAAKRLFHEQVVKVGETDSARETKKYKTIIKKYDVVCISVY